VNASEGSPIYDEREAARYHNACQLGRASIAAISKLDHYRPVAETSVLVAATDVAARPPQDEKQMSFSTDVGCACRLEFRSFVRSANPACA
jgi:hypothetical protein